MPKDNLHQGKETQEKLMNGVRKVAQAVGATMGSAGTNGLIETLEHPGHRLTNDGITIAEAIHLEDPIEDMGRKILLEAVGRSNKQGGDGSSTTCVLTSAILEEGMKSDISPMQLKAELEACVPLIEESIDKQKKLITVDEVEAVATIAAESPVIGKMIQEIYQQIGKDGIIHWDISKTFEDYYSIGKGITIENAGFVSPYMSDMNETTGQFESSARWTNPYILIVKQKINSAADFNDLFQSLFSRDIKEIVVFCDEYEANVVPDLIKTRAVRGFKTLLIKMPTLWKDWYFEDIAKATGATVIDPNAGLTLKQMTAQHLGQVQNIVVDKDTTYLDGIKDVSEYIKTLTEEGSDDSLIRASRLNTKTARYFVGAPSESALSHRRYKVEDAINSAYQALQGGIIVGGGLALKNASKEMPDTSGGKVLAIALWVPLARIIANTGSDYSATDPLFSDVTGFDTRTMKPADMWEAGIVDSANIVLNAVRNAISVAASILTASVVITYPRPDLTEQLIHSIMSKRP